MKCALSLFLDVDFKEVRHVCVIFHCFDSLILFEECHHLFNRFKSFWWVFVVYDSIFLKISCDVHVKNELNQQSTWSEIHIMCISLREVEPCLWLFYIGMWTFAAMNLGRKLNRCACATLSRVSAARTAAPTSSSAVRHAQLAGTARQTVPSL